MSADVIEVTILHGGGQCPRFEVAWHIFGQQPVGDAHNVLVMERREFIESAIKEKLVAEGRDGK